MTDDTDKGTLSRPVLLVVDDDREVLAAIERDLRRHFRPEYRIVAAGSPGEALDAARELRRRAVPVALFLADQRMPAMKGTEFLAEARRLHPEAKRVLLTAYADTDAAIAAINDVGLDHYLMKPWDPPDRRLYPVLDDLLADWSARVRPAYRGIRVAGSRWSPPCYAVREFLSSNQVPYQWLDVDEDRETRELVESMPCGLGQLPVVLFPDGSQVSCHVVVLAPGMSVRELDVEGVTRLQGAGIYYGAATSEAVLYRGRPVAILGGANSAGQSALFFSRYASEVHLLVRAPGLSPAMSQYLVDRIAATPNIIVHAGVEVSGVRGDSHLEQLELRDVRTGATSTVDTPALFIYIGVAPRTVPLDGFVELDPKGFVPTGAEVRRAGSGWPLERDPLIIEASVPGVFAVGDARLGANRRIAAAVGEGSAAIFSVHQYLRTV